MAVEPLHIDELPIFTKWANANYFVSVPVKGRDEKLRLHEWPHGSEIRFHQSGKFLTCNQAGAKLIQRWRSSLVG